MLLFVTVSSLVAPAVDGLPANPPLPSLSSLRTVQELAALMTDVQGRELPQTHVVRGNTCPCRVPGKPSHSGMRLAKRKYVHIK